MIEASPNSYDQLRRWYLARLRVNIQEEADRTSITPAGRIVSDKKAIQQLVSRFQEKVKVRRTVLDYLVILFLVFQFCVVCWLSLQEKSFLLGFSRYLQITFVSFCFWHDPVQFGSFCDWLCFLGFFLSPSLLLACLPASLFSNYGVTAKAQELLVSIPVAEISQSLLVILLICFAVQTSSQPIGLAVETAATPQRCFIACIGILTFVPLLSLKYSAYSTTRRTEKIKQLIKNIHGRPLTSESAQDEIKEGDNMDVLEKSVDELLQKEQAIADFSKTVLVCFDKNMIIEAISLSCLSEWGYCQAELLEKNLGNILFTEDKETFVEALHNVELATGSREAACGKEPFTAQKLYKDSFQHYCRLRKQDNSIVDCQMCIEWSPSLQKYFVSCEDVSDRMSLERARDNYIAQLTHDMQSPLHGIGLILESIQERALGELPQAVHNSVDVAARSLSRVIQLINDILNAEKLRHSKEALKLQAVDLVDLCRSAQAELQAQADASKVQLSCKLPSETPLIVRADPVLLNRVLVNFLSNAISYSPPHAEVDLTILSSSSSALVRVSDHGPGIHQDYHRVIFERFGAPKLSSKTNRPSTGIGLSVCQDIIKAHGGIIGVESEQGKGSTFWFSLALAQAAEQID